MNDVAHVYKIMNGYVLVRAPHDRNRSHITDSTTTVYFKEPKDAGEALAVLLAKNKLTRTEPIQLDMFENTKMS